MAGKAKAVGTALKYAPIVYTAAQKYGPVVWEQLKNQREPAEKYVQAKVAKGNQRKKALAHAGTLVDGAVLQVFHDSTAHWVVFSGDEPVGVHPPTQASYSELLDRADLSLKVRPHEPHRARPFGTTRAPFRSRPGHRTPPPQAPGPTRPSDSGQEPTDGTTRAVTELPTDRRGQRPTA